MSNLEVARAMARRPEALDACRQALGAHLAALRRQVGLNQLSLAEAVHYDRTSITHIENGRQLPDRPFWQRVDVLLKASGDLLAEYDDLMSETRRYHETQRYGAPPASLPSGNRDVTDYASVERLRHGLNEALSFGTVSNASLDSWEQTIQRYGRATRDRPAKILLGELTADLSELRQVIGRHRSASALRRLTRVTAQMSGLMCLTLVKLDDRQAFRRWARTGRLAASEAGDPLTLSWVLAQEAYGHYYSQDFREAIDVARHAQEAAKNQPGVGAALAAALEARGQAVMRKKTETRAALRRAESLLGNLPPAALLPSAFGYNEAQLRFHESNALTHLSDTKAAWRAQDQAFELIPDVDFMDRTFTELDRAICLAIDGDSSAASSHTLNTLTSLTGDQRQGIISLRAFDVLKALPPRERALPAASDLRELLQVSRPDGVNE